MQDDQLFNSFQMSVVKANLEYCVNTNSHVEFISNIGTSAFSSNLTIQKEPSIANI